MRHKKDIMRGPVCCPLCNKWYDASVDHTCARAPLGLSGLTPVSTHTCEQEKIPEPVAPMITREYKEEPRESVPFLGIPCEQEKTKAAAEIAEFNRQCGLRRKNHKSFNPQPTTASDILHQALETVKDRDKRYGDASAVFNTTIELFRTYTLAREGKDVTAQDTAIFNICQKIARIAHGEGDPDNWRDIAGYAALAAQVAGEG